WRQVAVRIKGAVESCRVEVKASGDVAGRIGGLTGTVCPRRREACDPARFNLRQFPDQIGAIQEICLKTVVAAGINREWLASLKCCNNICLPSLENLSDNKSSLEALADRQFPTPTENEAMCGVEVCQRVV